MWQILCKTVLVRKQKQKKNQEPSNMFNLIANNWNKVKDKLLIYVVKIDDKIFTYFTCTLLYKLLKDNCYLIICLIVHKVWINSYKILFLPMILFHMLMKFQNLQLEGDWSGLLRWWPLEPTATIKRMRILFLISFLFLRNCS